MNINRLINLGLRMLTQKGIQVIAQKGRRPQDMTPQEREQAKAARQMTQKGQRSIRTARRFMR